MAHSNWPYCFIFIEAILPSFDCPFPCPQLISLHLSSPCPGVTFPHLFYTDPSTGLGATPLCAHGSVGSSWGSPDLCGDYIFMCLSPSPRQGLGLSALSIPRISLEHAYRRCWINAYWMNEEWVYTRWLSYDRILRTCTEVQWTPITQSPKRPTRSSLCFLCMWDCMPALIPI